MNEATIYHIAAKADWQSGLAEGAFCPPSLAAEGFVHCAYAGQVCEVADQRYAGRGDLVLLEIDRRQLSHDVIDESPAGSNELFPHIYGGIPVNAVSAVHVLECGSDGRFTLPAAVQAAIGPRSC